MSNNNHPTERGRLSEIVSVESVSSTYTENDHSGSESTVGFDPASPPTSVDSAGSEQLATRTSAAKPKSLPQNPAQPQPPRRSPSGGVANHEDENSTELRELSHAGREVCLDGEDENHSPSERRSSSSTNNTTSSWISFLTGSISDSVRRPSSNWSLFLLLLHYVVFVAYSIGSFCVGVLQYWAQEASGNPNSAQVTLVKMQKLFGELAHADAEQAHKDATKMLTALATKPEAEAQWESIYDKLIEIVGACIGASNQTLTGTKCADSLKSASRNSSNDYALDSGPSYALQKRKLAKIRLIFEERDLEQHRHCQTNLAGTPKVWMIIVCVILLASIGIVTVMLRKRLYKGLSYLYLSLHSRRRRHITEHGEKVDSDDYSTAPEALGVSSSIGIAHLSAAKRRFGVPDAAHVPNNIWEMAAQGQLRETKRLKEEQKDFDVDKVHPRYGTLLSAAARSGNVDLVSYVLTLGPNLQKEGGQYHNALQSGASSGSPLVVQRLLNAGARDVSVGGYFGTTLNAAAERATWEVLVALLSCTSHPARRVNEAGGLHGRALIAAASRGQMKMVKDLLAHGADVNGASESGETALHAAASAKHLLIMETLLESGANKDLLSSAHGTALHVACRTSSDKIALLLIRRGASVNVPDQNQRTVLHEASKNGLADVVEAILARDNSTINDQDADWNTALHHAAISGHSEVAEILIEHSIDVSLGDRFQAQALFRAAGCRHPEVVHVLLEKGRANPNATDSFNQTALHGPAETEDVSVQRLLIEANANVNARGAWSRTPLHEACNMARYNNVRLLLSRPDIDVNVIDDSQTTPLCRCLSSTDGRYQDQCVDKRIPLLMLDYKQIDCEDLGDGRKPDVRKEIDVNLCHGIAIQEAARRNLIDVVRKMLEEHGGNIHVSGGRYGGVLHAAAMGGDVELLNMLLARRANINLQGGEYGTPLAAAAAYGNAAAVEALVENGADATIQGIGRYGSAYNSVCKALKVEEEGHSKMIALTTQIQSVLSRVGGSDVGAATTDLRHIRDRWQLMPNGYGWNAAGEL